MIELYFYSLQNLPKILSTLDDEESYLFLTEYQKLKTLHFRYSASADDDSMPAMVKLVNNFMFFCAKVQDFQTKELYPSNFPLGVFRFMLHDDLSWSPYYTVHRRDGYVVEGCWWSNGMVYQVRDDIANPVVHEVVLMIDQITQRLYGFPGDHQ